MLTPVKMVDDFILRAVNERASDIHIEPQESDCLVRIRVDGDLLSIAQYKRLQHDEVVARLKVLSSLRTDLRTTPQDGRFRVVTGGISLHIRISVMPTFYGEKCVLRLLPQTGHTHTLASLGFCSQDVEKISSAIQVSHGMILVVGPTGSGKTTTLYTLLQKISKPDMSTVTLEDPVEYSVPGITQIPIQSHGHMTFSSALRTVVRQDPDVIMVGEIRDIATAELSIHAALTGHVVFSTLHTNDAVTGLVRLVDIGVEPFLVASTVRAIVSQRLVRKICSKCVLQKKITVSELEFIKNALGLSEFEVAKYSETKLSFGKGCRDCRGTGFSGRLVVSEILLMSLEVRESVMQKLSADEIKRVAVKNGMKVLIRDAVEKVLQGKTTLSEVVSACHIEK